MLEGLMTVIKSKKIEIPSVFMQNTERTGWYEVGVESGYFCKRLD